MPAGSYPLTLQIADGGGSLKVSNSMRFQGSGAEATVVDRQNGDTVFLIDGAAARDVEINQSSRGASCCTCCLRACNALRTAVQPNA